MLMPSPPANLSSLIAFQTNAEILLPEGSLLSSKNARAEVGSFVVNVNVASLPDQEILIPLAYILGRAPQEPRPLKWADELLPIMISARHLFLIFVTPDIK